MNEESRTLLEKLNIVKTAKANIYDALIISGAADYLNESTPFIEYGDVITSVFTKTVDACVLSEYILFGAANMESRKNNKLTYPQFGDYLEQMSDLRYKLIDLLNLKGVQCTDNDTLENLINKIQELPNKE